MTKIDYQQVLQQNYSHLSKNKYFYLSLTLTTISIFIVFAIRPSVMQAILTYHDLQQLNQLQILLDDKKAELQEADAIIKNQSTEIALLSRALPTRPDESQIAKDINLMAVKNKMSLSSIRFGQAVTQQAETATDTDSDFAIIKFELNLIGVYRDLYNFIQEFNTYVRTSKITSVKITEYKEYKGELIIITATGEAYYKIR